MSKENPFIETGGEPVYVSVLMPVYDTVPEYLSQAIDSILSQTHPYFELLIYDDASTREDTLQTLEAYARQDARIRIVRATENGGVARARRAMIAQAAHSLCAFMDSDDISLPARLERQVDFFRRHPDAGICGTWFRRFPSGDEVRLPANPGMLDFLRENCLGNSTVMFRKEALADARIEFDGNLSFCEDYDLYSRAVRRIKIANIPQILLEYRERPDSLCHADPAGLQEADRRIHEKMLDAFSYKNAYREEVAALVASDEARPVRKNLRIPLSKRARFLSCFRLPVVVRLMGGLGNQMFQYAFGCALGEMLGRRVRFDLSCFDEEKKTIADARTKENKDGVVIRDYALDVFGKPVPTAAPLTFWLCKCFGGRVNEPSDSFRKMDETLIRRKRTGVWKGYFQNEGYFKSVRSCLESFFTFPSFDWDDTFNQTALMDIRLCDESVFVHVRRGDFVNLGWQLPASYYERAAAYMVSRLSRPYFFVFGDFVPEIMDAIRRHSSHVAWVGDDNARKHEDWKDMALMMECRHAIVANSSFSWWAAWLGRARTGVVTAPSPYMDGTDDGICDNWIKIPR